MKKIKNFILLPAALCILALSGCAAQSTQQAATAEAVSAEASSETVSKESSISKETLSTEEALSPAAPAETDPASASDDTVIRVGGLKGPTTMGLVKLMDDSANGLSNNHYEFTMVTAADELTALVAGNQVDIALLPANVAGILYQKTGKNISVIDINTLGVLYLVSSDTSILSVEDLKGKTVYLPGKGTTPEYALRYLLSAFGLSESDVTLEFKSEATEVASILAQDPSAIGLLPQPFVTVALSQNEALSIVLDLTQCWDSLQSSENPSRLVTGVTIVNNDFLSTHQDLVNTFLKEHEASILFTQEDPQASAALIAEAGIVAQAPLAQKALPYCNIRFLGGEDMKNALEGYLRVLLEQNPASVGGTLPDDAFYYIP